MNIRELFGSFSNDSHEINLGVKETASIKRVVSFLTCTPLFTTGFRMLGDI